MTLTQFIQQNRTELEEAITRVLGHVPATASCTCPRSRTDHYHTVDALNAAEIRQWIMNDEGLYRWARAEGVRI